MSLENIDRRPKDTNPADYVDFWDRPENAPLVVAKLQAAKNWLFENQLPFDKRKQVFVVESEPSQKEE